MFMPGCNHFAVGCSSVGLTICAHEPIIFKLRCNFLRRVFLNLLPFRRNFADSPTFSFMNKFTQSGIEPDLLAEVFRKHGAHRSRTTPTRTNHAVQRQTIRHFPISRFVRRKRDFLSAKHGRNSVCQIDL